MKKRRYLKKGLAILLTVAMVAGLLPGVGVIKVSSAQGDIPDGVWTDYAATSFDGGKGTKEDPYQIATAGQLAKLSKDVSSGEKYYGIYFKLTDDIDLSDHRWVPIGIYKWDKNGTTDDTWFEGFIDGNNKTISGLYVDETTDKNAAGFFGNIRDTDGAIVGAKDLTISGANIYASEDGLNILYAGILAGCAIANPKQEIEFENITVSGNVEITSTNGLNNVGGMIGGGARIKATNCKAENISVSGASNSGGFVGIDEGSLYTDCEVSGKVSGTWTLGGFVGYTTNQKSIFDGCKAEISSIKGEYDTIGGFVGYDNIGSSYTDCEVSGKGTDKCAISAEGKGTSGPCLQGGFVGCAGTANSSFENCKATNISITRANNSGGFVGSDKGSTYTKCEASGEVSGTWLLGGFVGYTYLGEDDDIEIQSFFDRCNADVEITGSDWRLGGFAGYAIYGKFYGCVAYGDVTSTLNYELACVGGFIGQSDHATVGHCHAAGKVTCAGNGVQSTGGFIGNYVGGTFMSYTFDEIMNSDLAAVGKGTIPEVEESDDSTCIIFYGSHDYSTEWTVDKAATCTTVGSKSHHCTRCGIKTDITPISLSAHTLTKTEGKAATCIEEGYDAYWTCEVCNKLFSDEAGTTEIDVPVITSKTDHKWDEGKVTKEPTETEEGVKTYTCSICGETKTEAIEKKKATTPESPATPEPPATPETPATPESPATPEPPKKGDVIADDKGTGDYKVTNVAKKEVAYQTPADKNVTTVSIPKTITKDGVTYKVTSIAKNAFANNKKITKVTIGSNVTTISDRAFYKCTSLTKLTIPSEVEKIGKQTFYGCKKLKTITIKTTKLTSKTVSKDAFKGLTKATTIIVPKKKLSVYKKLFKQKGLSSKVKVIGY